MWTGAAISPGGEILTTSQALGNSPIVDFQLWDSTRGQACVTGRDDDIGLALLKPLVEPPRVYDYLTFASETASFDDQLQLFQHTAFSAALGASDVRVDRYKPSSLGYDYFRIQSTDHTTADGAVLINERGELQGTRMPSLWLRQHEIGDSPEVWAVDAPKVASVALPILRSGRIHIEEPRLWSGGVHDSPGSLPVIFLGEITIDGAPAPVGSIVYARLSKGGQPDHWTWDPIFEPGLLLVHVDAPSNSYSGATIEFWMDCRRASTTAVFEGPIGRVIKLDLAF